MKLPQTVRGIFLSLPALLTFLALSGLALAGDLSGEYTCKGKYLKDEYGGKVTITKKGDSYAIAWDLGDSKHEGWAVEESGVLAVSFKGSDGTGVCAYKVSEDGKKLDGKWSYVDGAGDGTEVLTKP